MLGTKGEEIFQISLTFFDLKCNYFKNKKSFIFSHEKAFLVNQSK